MISSSFKYIRRKNQTPFFPTQRSSTHYIRPTDKHPCSWQCAIVQTKLPSGERKKKLNWPNVLCCWEATWSWISHTSHGPGLLSRGTDKLCSRASGANRGQMFREHQKPARPLPSSVPGDEKPPPGGGSWATRLSSCIIEALSLLILGSCGAVNTSSCSHHPVGNRGPEEQLDAVLVLPFP